MTSPLAAASRASASSEHTPWTGTPSTWAIVRAVTSPTRSPVNGPGPTPTAMPVRSAGRAPASASTRSISGASCSPWRMACGEVAAATTSLPSWSATVTVGEAVSKASSTVPRLPPARIAHCQAFTQSTTSVEVSGMASVRVFQPRPQTWVRTM